jgi:hypothetical protein
MSLEALDYGGYLPARLNSRILIVWLRSCSGYEFDMV